LSFALGMKSSPLRRRDPTREHNQTVGCSGRGAARLLCRGARLGGDGNAP